MSVNVAGPHAWLTKVDTPTALMATLGVAAEVVLVYWITQADESAERIVAGSLMVVVILGLGALGLMSNRGSVPHTPIGAIGGPKERATEEDVAEAESGTNRVIVGPDGTYLIGPAPAGWVTETLPLGAAVARELAVGTDELAEMGVGPGDVPGWKDEILSIRTSESAEIVPIPARTKVEGRTSWTTGSLSVSRASLLVIVLPYAEPPLFTRQPFTHSYWRRVGLALQQRTLVSVDSGTTKNQVRYLMATTKRRFADVLVDGHATTADVTDIYIGYEGDVRHHLLVLQYVSTGEQPETEEVLAQRLRALAQTFRRTATRDIAQAKSGLEHEAVAAGDRWRNDNGKKLFRLEYRLTAARLRHLDLQSDPDCDGGVGMLERLSAARRYLSPDDDEFAEDDEKWAASIAAARDGDLAPFRAAAQDMIDVFEAAPPLDRPRVAANLAAAGDAGDDVPEPPQSIPGDSLSGDEDSTTESSGSPS